MRINNQRVLWVALQDNKTPNLVVMSDEALDVTASWVVAGIDRVTILSLYQSAVYNETEYRRLRLSCCNKLLTISQLPSSS